MCAIEAGKRGRSVLVLERNDSVGKKIRISGGGRCNFTNIYTAPENFVSSNPNFHKSALSRYSPEDFIAMVRRHRITYHEKKLGQLFCDGSSQQVIQMLLKEGEAGGLSIRTSCNVTRVHKDDRFRIETNAGEFDCQSLVIATGGLSIPKIGATDLGYRIARQFGMAIRETRPALVPDDRRRRRQDFAGTKRRFARSGRVLRPRLVSRECPFYASRPERTSHSADLVLLEARRRDNHRTKAAPPAIPAEMARALRHSTIG